MSRHVVLLRRDPSLGLALRALLHGTGRVTELLTIQAWSALPAETVDAVVIDLPTPRRTQAIDLVRSAFGGRLVLVLDPSDDPAAVPSHHACSIVQRPFEIVELWHLVTTDPTPNGARGEAGRRAGEGPGPADETAVPPAARAPDPARPAATRSRERDSAATDPDRAGEARSPDTDASTWRWRGRRYGPATAIPPGDEHGPEGAQPGAPTRTAVPSDPAASANQPTSGASSDATPPTPDERPATQRPAPRAGRRASRCRARSRTADSSSELRAGETDPAWPSIPTRQRRS